MGTRLRARIRPSNQGIQITPMFRELLYKWFGLEPFPCGSCEVLRSMLDESNRERRDLLNRLLEKDKPEPSPVEKVEYKPIQPPYIPWNTRRQLLEAEDRRKAQLMRERTAELEKELGVKDASQ